MDAVRGRIHSRQQCGMCGKREWGGGERHVEADARRSHRVDMGRSVRNAAVTPDVIRTQGIDGHEHDAARHGISSLAAP